MTVQVFGPAALTGGRDTIAKLLYELLHPLAVGDERVVSRVDAGVDGQHCPLPSAAVGLEPALRAAPHGVHAIHLAAAAVAEDLLLGRRRAAVGLRDQSRLQR